MGIGARIKAIRTTKNLSLQEVADRAGGMSKGYLFRLEQDDEENPPNPSLGTLKKIAKALELSVSELINIEDNEATDQEWQEILRDRNLQMHFRDLQELSPKDQEFVMKHVKMLKKLEAEKRKKKK